MAQLNDTKEIGITLKHLGCYWVRPLDQLEWTPARCRKFTGFWFVLPGNEEEFDAREFEIGPEIIGPVARSAGLVICPHGKVEAYCRECDLQARVKLHDAVALAVMAERERCAKIIETDGLHLAGDQEEERQADIVALAAKIRSGE